MHLLGDVRLIESEKLAPPTVGTSTNKHSSCLKSASMETTTIVLLLVREA